MDKTKEALNKPDVVIDRWVIQLSKEDAAFNAWYLPPETFEPDFKGFLACLVLKRIAMAAEERLKEQKQGVREAKKAQKAEYKALEKAAEKLRKAEEKAQLKLQRAEEKARVKAEAKAEREKLKAEEATYKPMDIPTEDE